MFDANPGPPPHPPIIPREQAARHLAVPSALLVRYAWEIEGEPQDGLLVLNQLAGIVAGFWFDSWHDVDRARLGQRSRMTPDVCIRRCDAAFRGATIARSHRGAIAVGSRALRWTRRPCSLSSAY